ncbi:MAG: TRAP transporter small permease, partial [Clostridiales bacterium]|nr:TRAP transporter small permease [Clostridiales bacterium]
MKNAFRFIKGISRALDIIAGAGIVVITVMVVLNVLLRTLFNMPFRGIYEYVSYLTAAVIGLALAYCAVNNAHISIGFIMEKLPLKLRAVIDIVTKAAV